MKGSRKSGWVLVVLLVVWSSLVVINFLEIGQPAFWTSTASALFQQLLMIGAIFVKSS